MTDQPHDPPASANIPVVPDQRPDPHIMDYMLHVSRYKWSVCFVFSLTTALFLGSTYVIPQSYQTQSWILPPDRSSAAGMLSNIVEGSALSILKQVENPSVDVLQNFLESRELDEHLAADGAVRSFFGKRVKNEDELIASINESLHMRPFVGRLAVEGTVWTGWNPSPSEKEMARQLSAKIVNLATETVDSLFKSEFRVTTHSARIHADSDYVARRAELDSLDVVQEQFEQTHGIVAIDAQTTQSVAELAKLTGERDAARMKLELLARDLSPQDPRYREALAEEEEANRATREFAVQSTVGPSLAQLPEVSRQYLEIVRKKTSLEPIVSYLRILTEQERINEERQKSLLTILDHARPPDERSSPKQEPMILLGIFAGICLSIIYLAFIAFLQSLREESSRHGRGLGRSVRGNPVITSENPHALRGWGTSIPGEA